MRKINLIIFLVISTLAFSETAVLKNISGKVEVLRDGSTTWQKAKEGMVIELSDSISTGFGASATLDLGTSKVALKPLSRMTVDMVLETKTKVSTSLYLQVGAVKAEVDSKRGIEQSFQVQSPFSTASVRGTVFEFDGKRLDVKEGTVALFVGKPKRIEQKAIMQKKKEEKKKEAQEKSNSEEEKVEKDKKSDDSAAVEEDEAAADDEKEVAAEDEETGNEEDSATIEEDETVSDEEPATVEDETVASEPDSSPAIEETSSPELAVSEPEFDFSDSDFLAEIEQAVSEQQPKFNDDKAIFVTQGKSVEVVIQLTSQKITPEKKTEESVEEESDTQDDQQSEEQGSEAAVEEEVVVVTQEEAAVANSVVVADTSVVVAKPTAASKANEEKQTQTPVVTPPVITAPKQTDITVIWK